MMILHAAQPLFAWDCLEDNPSLKTIKDLLATLPDAKLLNSLRTARGKGRNDYPVHVLWGVVLLRVILRHNTTEAVLADLLRNEGLRRVIGIESEQGVPKKWNISRFEDVLGQEPHRTHLKEIFNVLIQRLGTVVDALGQETAGDATSLSARRKKAAQAEIDEGLPQASGGRKEYKDDQGNVTKVVEWFGYKLHLLVDKNHEVVLAYEVTDTKQGDGETLPAVLEQAEANLPKNRIKSLAFDKAADSDLVHETLSRKGIRPVIQMRSLWDKAKEPERMLPGHDGSSNIVYDEAGTIYCYDKISDPPVRHRMAYIGYEPERETIKYRCPAKHEGWACPMSAICNAGKSYGKTVRVNRELDLRRFPVPPRATKKFERLYKGRTSVERVNARLKVFWGVDDGNLTGSRRFLAQVGVVLAVHAAFATLLAAAPRREGTLGKLRLSPVAQALRQKAEADRQKREAV